MTVIGSPPASRVVIRGLRKQYGQTKALDGLDLVAEGGRLVGIAGPNGAGKSTMVKILAGEVAADGGEMVVDGMPWTPNVGARAVAVVHQEPQLFPNLSVIDNLLVGREGVRARYPRPTSKEADLLARFGIAAHARRRLGVLPLGIQQRVEIVRALAQDARVVLFDEPNSALTAKESDALFETMHDLATAGHVVILVSHRLNELARHAAQVFVVLDGRVSETLAGTDLTEEQLARAITVTRVRPADRVRNTAERPDGLRLVGWEHAGGAFGPIDLEARRGEITAIAGVEGSGGRELVRSVAGFETARGHLDLAVSGGGPHQRGIGYVPPDRRSALFFNFSVGENLVTRLDRPIRGSIGLRSRRRSRAVARTWMERMRVKASGPDAWIGSLSGGNQQKVLIASAMAPGPAVLVLEEPTRGVDIGSKREIYAHLRAYAAEGAVVLLYCTEIPEVFEVADRLLVIAGGRLSEPIRIADIADEKELAAEVARLEGMGRHGGGAAHGAG